MTGLYKADKSLRRYAALIERALSTWETSPQEWADYIAFLGRLLKVLAAFDTCEVTRSDESGHTKSAEGDAIPSTYGHGDIQTCAMFESCIAVRGPSEGN